jgi:hypothetical protein
MVSAQESEASARIVCHRLLYWAVLVDSVFAILLLDPSLLVLGPALLWLGWYTIVPAAFFHVLSGLGLIILGLWAVWRERSLDGASLSIAVATYMGPPVVLVLLIFVLPTQLSLARDARGEWQGGLLQLLVLQLVMYGFSALFLSRATELRRRDLTVIVGAGPTLVLIPVLIGAAWHGNAWLKMRRASELDRAAMPIHATTIDAADGQGWQGDRYCLGFVVDLSRLTAEERLHIEVGSDLQPRREYDFGWHQPVQRKTDVIRRFDECWKPADPSQWHSAPPKLVLKAYNTRRRPPTSWPLVTIQIPPPPNPNGPLEPRER